MNGREVTSFLVKRVALPLVERQIDKKISPPPKEEVLNKRIERLQNMIDSQGQEVVENVNESIQTDISPYLTTNSDISTSCIACSRSHISTVSALLKESTRFLADGDITHPEIQKRLGACEEEIVAMERFDLSAETIANSPPEEQEIIKEVLPRIRKLRQMITTIWSEEELRSAAAFAGELATEFRMIALKHKAGYNHA